jgi:hypothetical protein
MIGHGGLVWQPTPGFRLGANYGTYHGGTGLRGSARRREWRLHLGWFKIVVDTPWSRVP